MCYSREAILSVGPWDENLLIEDLDLNLRIVDKYEVDFVTEPLIYYRKHSMGFMADHRKMARGFEQYYEKYKHNTNWPMKEWMFNAYFYYGFIAANRGDGKSMMELMRKAWKLKPEKKYIREYINFLKAYMLFPESH
jgi:hypothetical protein